MFLYLYFQPEVVMNWNLMEYLPENGGVQLHFSAVIAGYISSIYQYLCQCDPVMRTPRRNRALVGSQSGTQTIPLGVGAHENTATFAKEMIQGELSQKLFM